MTQSINRPWLNHHSNKKRGGKVLSPSAPNMQFSAALKKSHKHLKSNEYNRCNVLFQILVGLRWKLPAEVAKHIIMHIRRGRFVSTIYLRMWLTLMQKGSRPFSIPVRSTYRKCYNNELLWYDVKELTFRIFFFEKYVFSQLRDFKQRKVHRTIFVKSGKIESLSAMHNGNTSP